MAARSRYARRPGTPLEEAKQFWQDKKRRRANQLDGMDKTDLHDLVSEYGIFCRSKTRKDSLIKAIMDVEMPDPENDSEYLAMTRRHATVEVEKEIREVFTREPRQIARALRQISQSIDKVAEDLEKNGVYAECIDGGYYSRSSSLPGIVSNCKEVIESYKDLQEFDRFRRILAVLGENDQPVEGES